MSAGTITITLTAAEADELSFATSDILCWCSGFNSAREGTGMDGGPMGLNPLRNFNIKLKGALDAAERGNSK
ncbi:hypothetical protein [Pseudogemmobacter sonorensis]|uniref:hypothetical protein n=1 Tax=Pseudogemmobacter sonorensis TaxID=2989681 RepID=UPI0036C3022B